MNVMLEDKGSYYLDTEATTTAVCDSEGRVVGYYYCPRIPKILFGTPQPVEEHTNDQSIRDRN